MGVPLLAVAADQAQTWTALGAVIALAGVMFRILSKPDARWQALVDAEQAARIAMADDLARVVAEVAAAKADRDYWQSRALRCEGGLPLPDRRE